MRTGPVYFRNGSHPSLAYVANIKRKGSMDLNLIEFFEENNETKTYLSQTPIDFYGNAGNVSQISAEDMPLFDFCCHT